MDTNTCSADHIFESTLSNHFAINLDLKFGAYYTLKLCPQGEYAKQFTQGRAKFLHLIRLSAQKRWNIQIIYRTRRITL